MKIGFSFGHCIRDIVEGKVPLDDVLLIVASTRFTGVEGLESVVDHYMFDRFDGLDRDEVLVVATDLYKTGRIHQPRTFGTYRIGIDSDYAWVDIVPTNLEDHPTVRDAWEQYRLVLRIVNQEMPDEETQDAVLNNAQIRY